MSSDKRIDQSKKELPYTKIAIKQFTIDGPKDVVIIYDKHHKGRLRLIRKLLAKIRSGNDILFVNGLRMAERNGVIKYSVGNEWFD